MCLWVVLETLLGMDNPLVHSMDAFTKALMYQEMELEDYSPQDWVLNHNLPDLLTQLVQIPLTDWIARQMERGSREPLPGLEAIWRNMEPAPPPATRRFKKLIFST